MNKNEFYMLLPSNSSMDYYPSNTASRYTTLLPKQVQLSGEWAVGLSEIQFPCNFLHIQNASDGELMFTYDPRADEENGTLRDLKRNFYLKPVYEHLPPGVYDNINDIVKCLNKVETLSAHFKFIYSAITGFVTIRRECNDKSFTECKELTHAVKFSDKLWTMLGFTPGEHHFPTVSSIEKGERPASLSRGLPAGLFIYSDLCTPYITGDVQSSLLRVVPFNPVGYTYGATHCATFTTPHYIPLMRSSFRTIEIDIRDDHGQIIPFDYGPLTVTLHFKRID